MNDKTNVIGPVVGMIVKFTLIAAILIFAYKGAMKAYDFGYRIFTDGPVVPGSTTTVSVAIVEGKSVMEIGEILEEKGLIHDARLFYFQELFSPYQGELKPGVYDLSKGMTADEMMAIMAEAKETEEDAQE